MIRLLLCWIRNQIGALAAAAAAAAAPLRTRLCSAFLARRFRRHLDLLNNSAAAWTKTNKRNKTSEVRERKYQQTPSESVADASAGGPERLTGCDSAPPPPPPPRCEMWPVREEAKLGPSSFIRGSKQPRFSRQLQAVNAWPRL